jgi:hypothetical protein
MFYLPLEKECRVKQPYFQSERAMNSHAYTENVRPKNEDPEDSTFGSEFQGQTIEVCRSSAQDKEVCVA